MRNLKLAVGTSMIVAGAAFLVHPSVRSFATGGQNPCPGNDANDIMVKVGSICVDAYEASVWTQSGKQLVQIFGSQPSDYCNADGNDCTGRVARSVKGVMPAANITWFQAQQACANAGKRLLTNAEWQMAAAGTPTTPDDNATTCNQATSISTTTTGSRSLCVSNWAVSDMVGNVWEWVADWVPRSAQDCPGWGTFSTDMMCFDGDTSNGSPDSRYAGPGALIRGGGTGLPPGTSGVFAINGINSPNISGPTFGFRCAR